MRLLLLALLCGSALAEEGPPQPVQFAQRMISTLPDLPQALAGISEGKADGIKSMISSVLGDGLISQLVVNPIGMAQEVLPDLGLNKTEVMSKLGDLGKTNNTQFSNSLFGKNTGFLGMFTTTQKPTTPTVMLIDGYPVKDFDEYIRKNNLEGQFSTKKPPAPTTKAPTADELVDKIANRLKSEQVYPPTRFSQMNYPRNPDDFTSTLNMAMVDPKRIQEVNTLLRRAPQHFGADSMDVFGNPPGFVQDTPTLDPAIDQVVTDMRTKGMNGLTPQDIRRMKDVLNSYETTLQTKEFIAKRNQLQLLQVELEEQRKQMESQKRQQEELHKKAQQIMQRKAEMESQLRKDLQSWNLTHIMNEPRSNGNLMDLPELNPEAFPTLIETGVGAAPPAFMMEGDVRMETTTTTTTTTTTPEPTTTTEMPVPPPVEPMRVHPKNVRNNGNIRFAPRHPEPIPSSTAIKSEDEEESSCQCQMISPSKLRGKWVPALASKSMIGTVYERISDLLHTDAPSSIACSRFQVSPFKRIGSREEARIMWEFQMTDEDSLHRMQGQATVKDRKRVNVGLKTADGDFLDFPMCILKTDPTYSYFVAVNAQGPCNEATLMVRDPNQFFSDDNDDLVAYLKEKVNTGELEKLEMLTFAKDCE